MRDVRLDDLGGGRRRPLAPELIDYSLTRDDLVRLQQHDPQKRSFLGRVKGDRPVTVADLERTEDAEVHTPFVPREQRGFQALTRVVAAAAPPRLDRRSRVA